MKNRAVQMKAMRLMKTSVTSVRQSGVLQIVGNMALAQEKKTRTSFPLDAFLDDHCALSDSLNGHSEGSLRPVHPRPQTPYSLPSGMISAAEK